MRFRIPKNKHYARPLWRWLFLRWAKKQYRWKVVFGFTCRYDLGSVDQLDFNKLCGVGFLPHHHKHSARFVWRYIPEHGKIEIAAYIYAWGFRTDIPLCYCEIGKEYTLQLDIARNTYIFNACDDTGKPIGGVVTEHVHRKKLQYGLFPYFGGNRKAPKDIFIQLTRL
jgi:hypothetical protein